jgi:hypothetical protein
MTTALTIDQRLAACFAELDDLRSKSPAEAERLYSFVAQHVKSAAPMAFFSPAVPTPDVSRLLADGCGYRLAAVEGCVVLTMTRLDAAMTAHEAFKMRQDITDVGSAINSLPINASGAVA